MKQKNFTSLFVKKFFENQKLAIVGSNLHAQRCITCQIGLPYPPGNFLSFWVGRGYSHMTRDSIFHFIGASLIPLEIDLKNFRLHRIELSTNQSHGEPKRKNVQARVKINKKNNQSTQLTGTSRTNIITWVFQPSSPSG